jgi:amino acid transporter
MNKKRISLISAVFIGVSSILGSGSLFVPYRAAMIAGPAAILAWLISAGLILLLALCLAELAALYPQRGLTALAVLANNFDENFSGVINIFESGISKSQH